LIEQARCIVNVPLIYIDPDRDLKARICLSEVGKDPVEGGAVAHQRTASVMYLTRAIERDLRTGNVQIYQSLASSVRKPRAVSYDEGVVVYGQRQETLCQTLDDRKTQKRLATKPRHKKLIQWWVMILR
jgi:hypothetical protein